MSWFLWDHNCVLDIKSEFAVIISFFSVAESATELQLTYVIHSIDYIWTEETSMVSLKIVPMK